MMIKQKKKTSFINLQIKICRKKIDNGEKKINVIDVNQSIIDELEKQKQKKTLSFNQWPCCC